MNKQQLIQLIRFVFLVIITLSLGRLFGQYVLGGNTEKIPDVSYTEFLKMATDGKISSVEVTEPKLGARKIEYKLKDKKLSEKLALNTADKKLAITIPNDPELIPLLIKNGIEIKAKSEDKPNGFMVFLLNWGPTLLFIGVWIFFMRRMSGGGKGLFTFNKNKAQIINPEKITVSFSDVMGCDEAKVEAQEFVDFLKNPDKFQKLGGRTPRGLLLSGPAGTGKTLLAKALAKESGVPFMFISGSEFVEMFVGVGAARVRDMFSEAKKHAPCVIFIDEIDAIGGARSTGPTNGAGDEREQTLNQILVELDGFDTHSGVILVAATNRPEILDKALLRPGRIDRQIIVPLPDVNGREQILKVHSKDVPIDSEVDWKRVAKGTPGFSGAELSNLVNEAAILAAREDRDTVTTKDFEKAKDKILMGVERTSMAINESDKRDTAYHEAGHAVVAKLLPNADPVHKVTIIPRGRALGVTMQLPNEDRWSYKVDYLKDKIAILMGGRAAEEIFCHTQTNGASNDISVATELARSMVLEWGMSSLGPIAYGTRGNSFLSNDLYSSKLSPETMLKIDLEVSNIINEGYNTARQLLIDNRDFVERMVSQLMEQETIDDKDIEALRTHQQ